METVKAPVLYALAGLPGAGKTTLSQRLARHGKAVHLRIDTREATVRGLALPDWDAVESREYHVWTRGRIVIDTAGRTAAECFEELLAKLDG